MLFNPGPATLLPVTWSAAGATPATAFIAGDFQVVIRASTKLGTCNRSRAKPSVRAQHSSTASDCLRPLTRRRITFNQVAPSCAMRCSMSPHGGTDSGTTAALEQQGLIKASQVVVPLQHARRCASTNPAGYRHSVSAVLRSRTCNAISPIACMSSTSNPQLHLQEQRLPI